MTPFAIFAFVLTFGYFIYFAVMITLDLTAKPAEGQRSEEEDIDVEGMKDEGVEAPKVISEAPDIDGGRMTYTDTITDDGCELSVLPAPLSANKMRKNRTLIQTLLQWKRRN
jgi:hypothetical protein